jgi:hypothetical protein
MSNRKTFIPLIVCLALLGCRETDADIADGDDPLRALTVPHRSERYTTTYWTQKSASDAGLWAQAVDYCADKTTGDYPNCDAVRHVDMLEKRSHLPADRPDTFRLTVPQAPARDTSSR